MNDCVQFPEGSRQRQICEGTSGLPRFRENLFRTRNGLPPLPDDSPQQMRSPEKTAAIASVSVGVAHRAKRRTGCSSCRKPKSNNTEAAPVAGKGKVIKNRPNMPKAGFINRAARYTAAIIKHVADDSAPTSIDDLMFRKSQCESCPFNVDDTCKYCECPLKKNILNNGKLSWRSEQCPLGRWFDQNKTKRPLVNPVRNLLFHIYPKLGAEWNWLWHIEQIRKNAGLFNGKICIGINVGSETAKAEDVQKLFDGINVSNWIVAKNNKMAETLTFTDLLECVQTGSENSVTMRGHTKGVTHSRQGIEQKWKELMWETCMDWQSVNDALSSHLAAGPMKCHEPLVSKQPYRWFYAGSFWWQRDKEVFQRDWRQTENSRWFSEYFPGMMFKNEEAACLIHDFTKGSVLNAQYWEMEVQPEWDNWRKARGR